jgi:hypothetical protein
MIDSETNQLHVLLIYFDCGFVHLNFQGLHTGTPRRSLEKEKKIARTESYPEIAIWNRIRLSMGQTLAAKRLRKLGIKDSNLD